MSTNKTESSENADDVAFEDATNGRYLLALAQRLGVRVPVALSTNEKWVGHSPHAVTDPADLGPLVARVGLDIDDADLGRAFYIGARYLSNFDHPVVSWDAPVARIFYEPGVNVHQLGTHVIVRRTLLERKQRIIKVFDSWTCARPLVGPFERPHLTIPTAPPSTRRPKPETPRRPEIRPPMTHPRDGRTAPPAKPAPSDPMETGMRAVDAVKYALDAPRSDALTSVLSTLQPDQYSFVTRTAEKSVIIQGHPGTGKTIIGIHRAAYLVSDERPRPARSLLLIGPTEEYVRHVSEIVSTLDIGGRVTIKSLSGLMVELAKSTQASDGPADGTIADLGQFIKPLTERAAALCIEEQPWRTGASAGRHNLQRLYEVLRNQRTNSKKLPVGNLSAPWCKTLPPFATAMRQRRYLPLFAQATLAIQGPARMYDHVIVDEAQDLRGLEWEVVRAHNRGSWTLLGDMNQRHTDFGDSSWQKVVQRLGLLQDNVEIEEIDRGYRSTQPILDFAKNLLPRDQRNVRSLQRTGPRPTVTHVRILEDRDRQAVAEAERLLGAYPSGTVAIITTQTHPVERALLAAGWRRSSQTHDWQRAGRKIALRTPASARGVEFDGVVVVEPGAFPKNLGRVGPLYTSLTRANRELAVVHHEPLPDPLRHFSRGR